VKLPPYGKTLQSGCCEIWVYFGSDPWRAVKCRAAHKLPVLLLPPDKEPEQFRWPVDGKEVLLIQQGRYDILRIPAFANLLFGYGASVVRAIYGENMVHVVCYRKRENANAA
jgi:hypothetical protein